ncbi:MAG TPA: hypothetical protein VMX94_01840 [Armatimonadota bacterium]|nr:hypothetical protein [Armatimonadota bacterium]
MSGEQDERLAAGAEDGEAGSRISAGERQCPEGGEPAEEARKVAASSTFGFYLLFGLLIALLVVGVAWLVVSLRRESITIIRPGMLVLACSSLRAKLLERSDANTNTCTRG